MKPYLHFPVILCLFFSLNLAYAAEETESKEPPPKKNEISEILDSMGYPELQVVPRASERLSMEAKSEDSNAVISHWPMQFAGLATMAVGLTAKGNERSDLTPKETSDAAAIASITTAVGLGGIVGGAILGLQRPYRKGANALTKYPGKDDRSALLRERLAEEDLAEAAKNARVMENVAVITDVTVNVACAWHSNETGIITAAVGTLLSFTPYIFDDHAIDVYDRQMDYKKKIFTPIKTTSFSFDPKTKTMTPLAGLKWYF